MVVISSSCIAPFLSTLTGLRSLYIDLHRPEPPLRLMPEDVPASLRHVELLSPRTELLCDVLSSSHIRSLTILCALDGSAKELQSRSSTTTDFAFVPIDSPRPWISSLSHWLPNVERCFFRVLVSELRTLVRLSLRLREVGADRAGCVGPHSLRLGTAVPNTCQGHVPRRAAWASTPS